MLQFLALLHPPGRERERLWERSLVELGHTKPETPYRALLEAQALHHLHRRPAARAQLSTVPTGPAEQALLGVLDGDLTRAASLDAIGAPLLALFARGELLELQRRYARPESELAQTLARLRDEVPRFWQPLLLRGAIGRFDVPELAHAELRDFPPRFLPQGSPLRSSLELVQSWSDAAEIFMAPRAITDRLVAEGNPVVLLHPGLWSPHQLDQPRLMAAAADAAVVADVARCSSASDLPMKRWHGSNATRRSTRTTHSSRRFARSRSRARPHSPPPRRPPSRSGGRPTTQRAGLPTGRAGGSRSTASNATRSSISSAPSSLSASAGRSRRASRSSRAWAERRISTGPARPPCVSTTA